MAALLQGELGFFVALVVFTMVLRWLWAIRIVTAKQWVYAAGPQQRRNLLWALPIVFFLHSGPWAVVAFGFVSWHLITAASWSGCGWGLVIGGLLMAFLTGLAVARMRRSVAGAHGRIAT